MKPEQRYTFTPASNGVLRWLTDPGPDVPEHIRLTLLGELFTSPVAVLMGVLNGLIVNGYALYLHGGTSFLAIMLMDIGLAVARVIIARRVAAASLRGLPVPTDIALTTAFLWCALQGAMAFTAMRVGIHSLELLAGITVLALAGPICARNFAAPRWALLLVAASDLPMVAGAVLSGEPWTFLLILQLPLFYYGSLTIIRRFQSLAIANLLARHESQQNATHDPLTGLLNRAGLMDYLSNQSQADQNNFILFYLDLDGFKAVNDTHGHQGGDRLLCQVAERLRGQTRSGDVVARLGGDEFVILAIGLMPMQGPGFAEALIEAVADKAYALDSTTMARIGVSVGFACCPEDAMSPEVLQHMADTALYESKNAGKGVQRRFSKYASSSKNDAGEKNEAEELSLAIGG